MNPGHWAAGWRSYNNTSSGLGAGAPSCSSSSVSRSSLFLRLVLGRNLPEGKPARPLGGLFVPSNNKLCSHRLKDHRGRAGAHPLIHPDRQHHCHPHRVPRPGEVVGRPGLAWPVFLCIFPRSSLSDVRYLGPVAGAGWSLSRGTRHRRATSPGGTRQSGYSAAGAAASGMPRSSTAVRPACLRQLDGCFRVPPRDDTGNIESGAEHGTTDSSESRLGGRRTLAYRAFMEREASAASQSRARKPCIPPNARDADSPPERRTLTSREPGPLTVRAVEGWESQRRRSGAEVLELRCEPTRGQIQSVRSRRRGRAQARRHRSSRWMLGNRYQRWPTGRCRRPREVRAWFRASRCSLELARRTLGRADSMQRGRDRTAMATTPRRCSPLAYAAVAQTVLVHVPPRGGSGGSPRVPGVALGGSLVASIDQ